mmetsp:Transcript_56549/g.156648  ORF Transcript_56549/g.156648 Transcript_56549/m.156648 type:complete len:253 (-) Transcript_56549:162-920(-)
MLKLPLGRAPNTCKRWLREFSARDALAHSRLHRARHAHRRQRASRAVARRGQHAPGVPVQGRGGKPPEGPLVHLLGARRARRRAHDKRRDDQQQRHAQVGLQLGQGLVGAAVARGGAQPVRVGPAEPRLSGAALLWRHRQADEVGEVVGAARLAAKLPVERRHGEAPAAALRAGAEAEVLQAEVAVHQRDRRLRHAPQQRGVAAAQRLAHRHDRRRELQPRADLRPGAGVVVLDHVPQLDVHRRPRQPPACV